MPFFRLTIEGKRDQIIKLIFDHFSYLAWIFVFLRHMCDRTIFYKIRQDILDYKTTWSFDFRIFFSKTRWAKDIFSRAKLHFILNRLIIFFCIRILLKPSLKLHFTAILNRVSILSHSMRLEGEIPKVKKKINFLKNCIFCHIFWHL